MQFCNGSRGFKPVFQMITSSRFSSLSNVWINPPLMPYSDIKCSFALIHAKTKTRFSSGKPRNIVYMSTYMIQNCVAPRDHNLCLTFKLSTACSTLNRLCNSRIKLGHNHAFEINTHAHRTKTQWLAFKLKRSYLVLNKEEKNKETRKKNQHSHYTWSWQGKWQEGRIIT